MAKCNIQISEIYSPAVRELFGTDPIKNHIVII